MYVVVAWASSLLYLAVNKREQGTLNIRVPADTLRPHVVPHDQVVKRPSCVLVPYERALPLVCDADDSKVRRL